MDIGSQKISTYCILSVLLTSFCLLDCSNTSHSPAPISSIKKRDAFLGTSSEMVATLSPNIQSKNIPKNTNRTTTPTFFSVSRSQIRIPSLIKEDALLNKENIKKNYITYNRDYRYIQKGSYCGGSTYTVKRGDTLFYIAWITGNDFRNLAKLNNIQAPYNLDVGRILQVQNFGNTISKNCGVKHAAKINARINSKTISSCSKCVDKKKENNTVVLSSNRESSVATTSLRTSSTATSSKVNGNAVSKKALSFTWRWPTKCNVIENNSLLNMEEGKGINIPGNKGQAIVAAADGRVVYSGNALRGYGNLIIIKHDDDYLSAYAHNDVILVREKQEVKAGQKIATMGNTGTSSTRLHFEIRYKGKPVNPLQYLPKQ